MYRQEENGARRTELERKRKLLFGLYQRGELPADEFDFAMRLIAKSEIEVAEQNNPFRKLLEDLLDEKISAPTYLSSVHLLEQKARELFYHKPLLSKSHQAKIPYSVEIKPNNKEKKNRFPIETALFLIVLIVLSFIVFPKIQNGYKIDKKSTYRNEGSTKTPGDPRTPPPQPPSNLKALPISSTGIDLSWEHNSLDEKGFSIERRWLRSASDFIRIDTLIAANQVKYQDKNLLPGETYLYRMRSYNVTGSYSEYSNTVGATTLQVPPFPPGPTNPKPPDLQAKALSSTEIALSWKQEDKNNNIEGFRIERKLAYGISEFREIKTVSANQNSYTDSSLQPTTTYTYRVHADYSNAPFKYSNEASATTTDEPPPPPHRRFIVIKPGIVKDNLTSLYWQQFGSEEPISFESAQAYVDTLNISKFGDSKDWRLPNKDEAESLMTSNKNEFDSVFNGTQRFIWTSNTLVDGEGKIKAIVIDFNKDQKKKSPDTQETLNVHLNYVRAARGISRKRNK